MSRQQGQPAETPEAVTMETVLDFLPEPEDFLEAADIFQQLGDSSRLRIFWLLCHCEACGVEIAAAVEMSSAAVAHHLKTLRLGRLVQSRRRYRDGPACPSGGRRLLPDDLPRPGAGPSLRAAYTGGGRAGEALTEGAFSDEGGSKKGACAGTY